MDSLLDARVRTAAFEWLSAQVARFGGDVLPFQVLRAGFVLDGARVPLLGPQGIFKPRILEVPLSITTAPSGPYADGIDSTNLLRYRYRGTNPEHHDNVGLRTAFAEHLPLVYLHGVMPGKYMATWPVFVVDDDPEGLTFTVQLDASAQLVGMRTTASIARETDVFVARRYGTASVKVRLHQRVFRERVLDAYRRECAFCRFRHEEMLDAAHITPDAHADGEPMVSNGLALCTLHHSAFDRLILGVTPDYVIQVRPDVLDESDGPTLAHGIQALHGQRIWLPTSQSLRPDPERLAARYEQFREGSR